MELIGMPKKAIVNPNVKEATTDNFERDVIDISMTKPVVVEFWAPWCGPCRQLMPMLEKAVNDSKGSVLMVKINIDENPELAAALRVQSVPMVYAFYQGQPVDGFTGLRPESELRAFITKLKNLAGVNDADKDVSAELAAADIAKLLATADAFFKDSKLDDAIASYSIVLDAAPDNMDAMAGIGWCLMAQKEFEGVSDIITQLEETQKTHPRIKGLMFIFDRGAEAVGDMPEVAKKPEDCYSQALHYLKQADIEAAIDALVECTRLNREWEEQKARKLLLDLFDALGTAHPLTSYGRRRLSAVLFS